MPEIILKDKSGTEQTYDYKKVSFRTPTEGEKAEFIFPNFAELEVTENGEYSVPEGVDGYTKVKANVPVPTLISGAEFELDFSNGDIHITAPDGYAFTGGTIKKPETLIPENIAKDVEVAGIVGTHEGGGGSVEGTATVTFCNYDGTELFSRPVFVGDNCPDPIAQGKINEPTRESSAQYTYAYNGWSLTAGGTASASALNVVTEDRTVYAAYTQNVRYYTVRFYDGATLMQETQEAYGSKATPPDTIKAGYAFVGWTPSDLTIYGDTDFYGEWVESVYASLLSNPSGLDAALSGAQFFGADENRCAILSTSNKLSAYKTDVTPFSIYANATVRMNSDVIAISPNKDLLVIGNSKSSSSKTNITILKISESGSLTDITSTYYSQKGKVADVLLFNNDGSKLIEASSYDTTWFIWDTTTTPWSKTEYTLATSHIFLPLVFNGSIVYAGAASNTLYKVDLDANTKEYFTGENAEGVRAAVCNPDFSRLAIWRYQNSSRNVDIYDISSGKATLIKTLDVLQHIGDRSVHNIKFSPDGKVLLVAGNDAGTYKAKFYNTVNDSYSEIQSVELGSAPLSCTYNDAGTRLVIKTSASPYVCCLETKPF